MNIRDLEYFVAVAQTGHFGKAANIVHVSQPTLSMQLKKLEEELGLPLLERGNKESILSRFGEQALPLAEEILRLQAEIISLAKSQLEPGNQELQIGIFPTLAPYLLPHLIPIIKNNYPNLKLVFQELKTIELLQHLKSGKLDLAIMADPIRDPSLKSLTLFAEPFYLALHESHPLAAKKTVNQQDLQNIELLLLEDGHCFRDQALEICHVSKAVPKSDLTATSIETLMSLVAAGFGTTLVPKLAINQQKSEIRYLKIINPVPERAISLFFRASHPQISFCEKLGTLITTSIKNSI